MSDIAAALERIRVEAEAVGVAVLAREADVPLTTVRSFAERGWTHKNLDIVERLSSAADRLKARRAEALRLARAS